MKSFNILLSLTAISIALATFLFFYPQTLGAIPYGTITFAFATFICFWVWVRLGSTVSRLPADESVGGLVKTIRAYFLVMGVFFFLDWFPHVGLPWLYPNDVIASHFHTFAHIFFFIGTAILVRIPVSFINTRWKNAASIVVAIFGVITVGWRFNVTDRLVYIFGPSLPPIIIVDTISDVLFLGVNSLALLIPGAYLVFLGIKSLEPEARVRAVLLGLGMMTFFAIGPVIDLVHNQYTQLIIHLLQAISFFLMGASALYEKRLASPRTPMQTT